MGTPPLRRRTQICRKPPASRVKATDLPSGEMAGNSSIPAKSVSRRKCAAFAADFPAKFRPIHHEPAAISASAKKASGQRTGRGSFFAGKSAGGATPESEIDDSE